MKAVMRVYSYLFHALLALFLIGLAGIALASGLPLRLDMLPWSGATLTYVLLPAALFGLISVLLALKGTARILFFLWSLVVFVVLVRGYFVSAYRFRDTSSIHTGLLLTVGALLAIFGAWFQMRRDLARR